MSHRVAHHLGTLAFPCFDGCYLPRQENVFVHTVLEELDAFLQRDDQKSILLFPPLPSRLRFLIHKTAENRPELSTFSVGESWSRRVVICYSHLRLPPSEGDSSDTDGSLYERPYGWSRPMEGPSGKKSPGVPRGPRRASRRPDQAIYVPRAMRARAGEGSPASPGSVAANAGSSRRSLSLGASEESCSDTAEGTAGAGQEHDPGLDSADESPSEQDGFMQLSGSEPCPWPPSWDQTVSYFMAMTLQDQAAEAEEEEEKEEEEEEEEECASSSAGLPAGSLTSLDSKEESGDVTQEIMANLKEPDVAIENVHSDYSSYENVWINQDDFSHVIEIYDFPAMFKTEDLMDAFTEFSDGGMKIKWVDNTHALGVFSSESAATQALSIKHPLLKTRTLSEGSKKAKGKAIRRAEFIQPVKERPRTDSAVARRMVTRALGLQRGGSRGNRC